MTSTDLYATGNDLCCGAEAKFSALLERYERASEDGDAEALQRLIDEMGSTVADLSRIRRMAERKINKVSGLADDASVDRDEIRYGERHGEGGAASRGPEAGDVDHLTEMQDYCQDGDFENMSASEVL